MKESNEIEQFYRTLFNPREVTCFSPNKFGTKLFDAIKMGVKSDNSFFVINPHQSNSKRGDDNIKVYRNFLFEIDEQLIDGQKVIVPLKDQANIIYTSHLPFSTCVSSGSKSLHWIVSLDDDTWITDKMEYRAVWTAMQTIINAAAKELGFELKVDPATKNPSRFSRAAGALRMDFKDPNTKPVIQELKKVKSRISVEELLVWFESKGVDWTDYMPKQTDWVNEGTPSTATDKEKWDWCIKHAMKNDVYEQGNRHTYQVKLIKFLLRTGVTPSACDTLIKEKLGEISTGIKSASNIKVDGAPIYVWSKADRIAWAERMQQEEAEEQQQRFVDQLVEGDEETTTIYNGEVAYLNGNGLGQYIRVGTKYYRVDNWSIESWDKATIKDDFGANAIHRPELRKFRGFCNEPNFLEKVEYVTKIINGEPHTFYNKFFFPHWKLKECEAPYVNKFPTTMKLLTRTFVGDVENQLEIGLDWIQLMLTQPKRRLKQLALVGDTETGKDTFMEWVIKTVGESNGILLGGEELESQYNSIWAGKYLVCLNEVSYDLGDKKLKERMKNLLTSEKLTVEGKGENRYQIENYTKIVLATNNIYDFMKIDDNENRTWVRQMPPLDKKKDFDPRFIDKLDAERPYFLYWITKVRELSRKEKAGRFWHSDEEYMTDALRKVMENTKTSLYTEIFSCLEDRFNHSQLKNKDSMFIRAKSLTEYLNVNKSERYNEKAVKMCLLKEFRLKDKKTVREDAFDDFKSTNNVFFEIPRSLIMSDEIPIKDYFNV